MASARTYYGIADKLEPKLRREVLAALRKLEGRIPLSMLTNALRSRSVIGGRIVLDRRTIEKDLHGALDTIEKAFWRTGLQAAAVVKLRFDIKSPEAIAAARANSAALVTRISREVRRTINGLIVRAFEEGVTSKITARDIRPLIGLTTRDAQAVMNLRADLLTRGLSPGRVAELTGRYARKLLRQRASTISRTEIIDAANSGQDEAWRQAEVKGLLRVGQGYVWIVTLDDRYCLACKGMHGQIRRRGELYVSPYDGSTALYPTLHPRCWTPDHDVWTAAGWKPVSDIREGDVLWTLDSLRTLTKDVVADAWRQPHAGPLIHASNRTTDLLVTPDHAMAHVTKWKKEYSTKETDRHCRPLERKSITNMVDGDSVPRTGLWTGPEPAEMYVAGRWWPSEDFTAFVGWYITEGSIGKPTRGSWQIKISQEKPAGRAAIEPILRNLFPTVWVGREAFYVPLADFDELIEWLLSFGHSNEKRVPADLLQYGRAVLQPLFDSMIGGDGTRRTRQWVGRAEWTFQSETSFSTSSPGLVDDMTEIAQKIGLRTTHRIEAPRTTKHWNGTYTSKRPQHSIGFGRNQWTSWVNVRREPQMYDGDVVGFSMANNPVVLVRRNGKTLWVGNCRCARRAATAREMAGR